MRRLAGAPAALVLGVLSTLGSVRAGEAQSADTLRVQTLAPMVTSAEALAIKLDAVGFTQRRANTGVPASQFMTRFDIEKRAVTDLSQLLRRMKGRAWGCSEGVLFVDGVLLGTPVPDQQQDTARFVPTTSRGKGMPVVSSAPMPKPNPLDMIALSTVDALEVYTGPSEIPLEFKAAFRQARCVVVVWTR
jgi:hypothetical protein